MLAACSCLKIRAHRLNDMHVGSSMRCQTQQTRSPGSSVGHSVQQAQVCCLTRHTREVYQPQVCLSNKHNAWQEEPLQPVMWLLSQPQVLVHVQHTNPSTPTCCDACPVCRPALDCRQHQQVLVDGLVGNQQPHALQLSITAHTKVCILTG